MSSRDERGRQPIGNLEAVQGGPGQIEIAGWALDPDTVGSIPVHVYVDGVGTAYLADEPRPDVARVYPLYGAAHGFSERVVAGTGRHDVCVFAINTGPGTTNPELGCRNVTVAADTTAPETTITSGPAAAIAGTSVALAFSATEAATFTCRWDGGGWTACT